MDNGRSLSLCAYQIPRGFQKESQVVRSLGFVITEKLLSRPAVPPFVILSVVIQADALGHLSHKGAYTSRRVMDRKLIGTLHHGMNSHRLTFTSSFDILFVFFLCLFSRQVLSDPCFTHLSIVYNTYILITLGPKLRHAV